MVTVGTGLCWHGQSWYRPGPTLALVAHPFPGEVPGVSESSVLETSTPSFGYRFHKSFCRHGRSKINKLLIKVKNLVDSNPNIKC